jgi:small-conductance mechanosensitive channel
MRTFLGTLAAVLASLAVPVAFLVLAWYEDPLPGEGDAFERSALIFILMLLVFAALLAVYHGLGALIARRFENHRVVAMLGFSVVASLAIATLALASGDPVVWERLGDVLLLASPIWVFLVLGSAIQYAICFRATVPKTAELAAARPTAR